MTVTFRQCNVNALAHFDRRALQAVSLFELEEMRGVMLCFEPGQELAVHSHAHEHEAFDVLSGNGMILVGEHALRSEPGKLVFVPADTPHGFRNDTDQRWLVRATILQRTYPRHVGRLMMRALRKRLGLAPS